MKRKIPLGQKRWKEIIKNIERRNQGLADTLALIADHKLQRFIKLSEKDIRSGQLIPLSEV